MVKRMIVGMRMRIEVPIKSRQSWWRGQKNLIDKTCSNFNQESKTREQIHKEWLRIVWKREAWDRTDDFRQTSHLKIVEWDDVLCVPEKLSAYCWRGELRRWQRLSYQESESSSQQYPSSLGWSTSQVQPSTAYLTGQDMWGEMRRDERWRRIKMW